MGVMKGGGNYGDGGPCERRVGERHTEGASVRERSYRQKTEEDRERMTKRVCECVCV